MQFGMYQAEWGYHREATCATQALDMWQNAPRTEGHWRLIIDGVCVKEEYEPNEIEAVCHLF